MQDRPHSCCDAYERLDFSKVSLPENVIDWTDVNLIMTISVIIINNVFWHLVAQYESRTRKLSNFCNSRHVACYVFMFIYLALLHKQEQWFQALLRSQPTWHFLSKNVTLYFGYSLTGLGVFLIGAGFRSLKVTGTFLGPAFGIQGHQDPSKFPSEYPHHVLGAGSVLFHVGLSAVSKCQAGFLVASLLAIGHALAMAIPCRQANGVYNKKED